MNFTDWLKNVPPEISGDSLWKMEAYRLALFFADLSWYDVTRLMKDKRTVELSNQLYASAGSMPANISEGYSRGTGKDRARFYEYALGSGRESRGWYYHGRHILGQKVIEHRMRLVTHIIRLLLAMIPDQRGYSLHENPSDCSSAEKAEELIDLLQNVPMA